MARLNVGYEPDGYMTERESLYLEAHNVRRKEWHERDNLSYVPLTYSPGLARQSKVGAEELLHACGIVGIQHEDHVAYGENLAKNAGNLESWGQLYPPTKIVGRWANRFRLFSRNNEQHVGDQCPSILLVDLECYQGVD